MELIKALLQRTIRKEIKWKSDDTTEGGGYYVWLSNTRLEVWKVSPSSEPDYVAIRIFNGETQRVVAYWRFEQNDSKVSLQAESLYLEIEKYLTGWDDTLSDLEKELGKPGVIGDDDRTLSGEIPF
jgi:hypothetical protein